MKKSIVISLLTIVTLFCTAICSLASTGKVTTDTLRVRKEPSTDSSTIALLSIGDEIEILGEENGWYKIQSGENVGYVAAQYINVLTNTKVNTDENTQNVDGDKKENENTNQNANNEENSENNQNENTENQEQTSGETITVLNAGEKIYITPLINSLVLSKLEEEKQVEIVSEINGWSYIKQSTTSGWVRTESIQRKVVENNTSNNEENNNENKDNNNNSSQTVGYISANSVNFRKTPNTSGEVIRKLSKNDQVTIKTKGDTWAEIEYDGDTGYVSVDYISDKEVGTTSRSSETRKATTKEESNNAVVASKASAENKASEQANTGNTTGADVVAYAKQYLGSKYISGGASPKGFDCSGFTTYVFKHFGISLNRTSSGQASNGTYVGKADLIPGDIICFSGSSSSRKIGHVGIYIGGGKFIHAANSRKGVIISNVSGDGYYYVAARRVI